MANVHESREGNCHTANVNQIAEQAILAKDTLGLVEQTGHNGSSSDGVEIRHDICDSESLSANQ
jgi:hypothetical protein